MLHPLTPILAPRSVALVGASREPGKIGFNVLKRLIEGGFSGEIYPINPNAEELFGLRCYPSVTEVPWPVDLAVLTVTDRLVPRMIDECIQKGIKSVIIITAGFGETGPAGKAEEHALIQRARSAELRIVGPNCMGVYNAAIKLNVTGMSPIPAGPLALVSQSGGLGQELFHTASRIGTGFSYFISLGNEADIQFHEYLEYLEGDEGTRTIMLYLEGLNNGRRFLEVAARVARAKPIVAIKGGATLAGSRSTVSHTGSLAGEDRIYDAAFRQAGIIRVQDPEELIEIAHSLSILPLPKGRRVGLLCDGGGYATLLADAAERHNFSVPVFSMPLQERLAGLMPHRASPRNPVEFAGAADDDPLAFARCAEACLQSHEIDGILFAGTFGGYAKIFSERLEPIEVQTSRTLGALLREHAKPMIMQTYFARDPIPALQILREEGVPVVASLGRGARCLAALVQRRDALARPVDWRASVPSLRRESEIKPGRFREGFLLESEAYEILDAYGIQHPAYRVIHDEWEVESALTALGTPIVMKILSRNIPHKSDLGGVALDLVTPDQARQAFAKVMAAARHTEGPDAAVLVARQAPRGMEMVVGVVQDPAFGPVMMVGLGGIFVELLQDVAFRVVPVSRTDAEEMVRELRAFNVLQGYRGYPPANMDALVDLLSKVSTFVQDCPRVQELDLNPVILHSQGLSVVDVKLRLGTVKER